MKKRLLAAAMAAVMLFAKIPALAYDVENTEINMLFSDYMTGSVPKGFAQSSIKLSTVERNSSQRSGSAVVVSDTDNLCYFNLRNDWTKTAFDTFEGFTFDKRIIESINIELTEELLKQMTSSSEIRIKLNGGSGKEIYQTRGFGRISLKANKSKDKFAVTEVAAVGTTYITANTVELEPGRHKIAYSYMPGDNHANLYIDGICFSATADVNGDLKINAAKKYFDGLRFEFIGFGAVTEALYFDSFEVYQPLNDGELTVNYSSENNVVSIESSTSLNEYLFDYIFIKDEKENTVPFNGNLHEDKKNAYISFDENVLKSDSSYYIHFDAAACDAYYNLFNQTEVLSFKTPPATEIYASFSFYDGEFIDPDNASFDVNFTGAVSTEEFTGRFTITDEDGNLIKYNVQKNDSGFTVFLPPLDEYIKYTAKIDKSLVSEDLLPISGEISAVFVGAKRSIVLPADPYIPDVNNDVVVADGTNNTPSLFKDAPGVSQNSDENGEYLLLSSGKTNTDFPISGITSAASADRADRLFSDNNDVLTFSTKIRLSDKAKIANSSESDKTELIKLGFSVTDSDLAQSDEYVINKTVYHLGQWGVVLNVAYVDGALYTYKSNAKTEKKLLLSENEIEFGKWIELKINIDSASGIANVSADNHSEKVNLNIGPNWGGSDVCVQWAPYMYLSSLVFNLMSAEDINCEMGVRDIFYKRMSNTLSIVDASFNYGDKYIDTENVFVDFNDDISTAELNTDTVYISDSFGNKTDDSVEILSVDGTRAYMKFNNLKPYTEYTLNISGVLSVFGRSMSKSFNRAFVTKKESDIFVDIYDNDTILNTYQKALRKADKLSVSVAVNNLCDEVSDVTLSAAVYGRGNELTDIIFKDVLLSHGKNVETFEFDNLPAGTEDVRIYVFKDRNLSILHAPDSMVNKSIVSSGIIAAVDLPQIDVSVTNVVNGEITVSACGIKNNANVVIAVLSGADASIDDAEDKLVAISYARSAENAFSSKFVMKQPSGEYTVYVVSDGAIYKKNYVSYVSVNDIETELIDKIANGDIATESIFDHVVAMNAGIGLELDKEFLTARDVNLFNKRMGESRSSLDKSTQLKKLEAFNDIIHRIRSEIAYLNELSAISYYSFVQQHLEKGVIYTGINFDAYNNLTDEQKSNVASDMLGVEYNNGEAVKSLFDSLVKKYSSVVRDDGGSGGAKRTSGSTGSFSSADMKPPKNTESGLNNDIFSDMANQEWAKEAVASLTRRGIVNGVSATEFNPDGNVTREQFTKMAVLAAGIYDKNSSAEFTDADENAWYYSYISSARESNLITGRPDGSFGVGEYITKEDIAVIMMRIMVLNGKSPSDGECMISDISAVSDYAVDAVKMLNSYGIIKGDENARFEPKRYSTRAEAAFVIYSLLKECDVK